MYPSRPSAAPLTPWGHAVVLLETWIADHERVDALLERLPTSLTGVERARCQSLLFGAVRHRGRLQTHLYELMERPPRPRLEAILQVAGFELIEDTVSDGVVAKVVHHAVEQAKTLASESEARLVNAVIRRLAERLSQEPVPGKFATPEVLARYFSHPEWMVKRWLAQFGAPATRQLLEWNQGPAEVHARWRLKSRSPSEEELVWLKPTPFSSHYQVAHGHWADVELALRDGRIYLTDPSTRLALDLLDPKPGETLLDACAAPGGKSVAIGDRLSGEPGRLIAMDLPGTRVPRLKENLARIQNFATTLIQGDASRFRDDAWAAHGVTPPFDGILLDVPCSNTGVMRHRVDVKWRVTPKDLEKHSVQQATLLWSVSRWVAPGGRLVYSTCSIDDEENEHVVATFLERTRGRFTLEKQVFSRPWETGCEGAGAFLLRRAT